jgi:hypothetical protein
VLLADRHLLRLAVDRGTRGEDEGTDAMASHRVEQRDRLHDVVAEVEAGVRHRLAHRTAPRHVDDRPDRPVAEHAVEDGRVAVVPVDQRRARNRRAMPGGEIVEDQDLARSLDEATHDVAADVPGASGHQNAAHRRGYYQSDRSAPEAPPTASG